MIPAGAGIFLLPSSSCAFQSFSVVFSFISAFVSRTQTVCFLNNSVYKSAKQLFSVILNTNELSRGECLEYADRFRKARPRLSAIPRILVFLASSYVIRE
jgi:hypothetical protein